MTARKTKSPIKDLPVRQAGQSLDERIQKVFDEKVAENVGFAGLAVVFIFLEWWRYWFKLPPMPWVVTVMCVGVVALTACRIRKAWLEIQNLKLGLVGERAVGQYLEEKLRPLGCQVLHDIPFDGFNIDHVVIGQGGVYCIETKTHSKPEKGACEVKYDGKEITVNGFKPDRDPIVQAKANARSLYELLESSTGKKFSVKPVVLYPGWFISKMPPDAEVWVLNEKALPSFIGNAKASLPPEDINLITYHLKRYVIARGKSE